MEVLAPLVILAAPLYWMWRTHVATNARIKYMGDIDSFLNPEKGNSEMSMDIVYNAYEDSKGHFFLLEMMFFAIFRTNPEQVSDSKKQFKTLPEAERKKVQELVTKMLLVNLKLSPLTYFFAGIFFLCLALIFTLANHLSPKKIKASAQNLKERTLYSIYSF